MHAMNLFYVGGVVLTQDCCALSFLMKSLTQFVELLPAGSNLSDVGPGEGPLYISMKWCRNMQNIGG